MKPLKYIPYPKVNIVNRQWPGNEITKAPVWCSVDLRDGNQALSAPMTVEKKLEYFKLLVKIGFKEIEVGFPASSETEYKFVRELIEGGHIPQDVTIQALTPGRRHLIERTFQSLKGVRSAIINLYYPTSAVQREVVLKKNKTEILSSISESIRHIKNLKNGLNGSSIILEFCPENFMGTELEFALKSCQTAIDSWMPTPENKLIINLPATVEISTPNAFADHVEWMRRALPERDCLVISVHTHNDRGTAVAAGELALLAGAERVEGALFGNGERSGNLDIITMALNLFSHGISSGLDLSDIKSAVDIFQKCTGLAVHPRHPYAGESAFTTFSGSHQDAINKALYARSRSGKESWEVPYLPIDPDDIGRKDEQFIRINSQSGKGGVEYILKRKFGIDIAKELLNALGYAVKESADTLGRELRAVELLEHYEKVIQCKFVKPGGKL